MRTLIWSYDCFTIVTQSHFDVTVLGDADAD